MSFTYTRTVTKVTTVETTLEPGGEWGMFTKAGNLSLKNKARRLIQRLEELRSEDNLSKKTAREALVTFVAGWERMKHTKSYAEAWDTDVRERVASFVDKVWEAVTGEDAWDIWDEVSDEAYSRVQKERKSKAA